MKPTINQIKGHGIDIIDIADFSRLMTTLTKQYLNRLFTIEELISAGEGVNQLQKLAGRFACKEAVMKALGVGWGNGVAYTDVVIENLETGAPRIKLQRNLVLKAEELGINSWSISISHSRATAVASAIAIQKSTNPFEI